MASDGQRRERLIARGALAGLVAPVLFHALHWMQAVQASGYDPIRDPIGVLTQQPMGWLQGLNFLLFGLLYIVFARGLGAAIEPNLGPWLQAVGGLGVIVMGVFPWRPEITGTQGAPGHMVGAYMAFLGAGAGFIALWQPMRNDARWHRWSYPALVTGLAMLAFFLGYGWYVEPSTAALHVWEGAAQGVLWNLWFICTFILAWHLRSVAHEPGSVRQETRPPLIHPGEPAA